MSWSFEILNGDLNLSSRDGGMGIVTGPKKTLQDLRLALSEPVGTDPMHMDFGTMLDGGKLSTGEVVSSLIGGNFVSTASVEEEIRRVILDFSARQNERIKRDLNMMGRTTVPESEIIDKISYVRTRFFGNKLVVRVGLVMKNNASITITQPIG